MQLKERESEASMESFIVCLNAELAGDIAVSTSALCSFTLFGWSLLFRLMGLISPNFP